MEPATAIDTLLDAAVLAPSGDNTQPWQFGVDRERRCIQLDIDKGRDPSPMNAGQRMSRISLGAVLQTMVRTAEHNSWQFELDVRPDAGLAMLRLLDDYPSGTFDPIIAARVTNRHVYQPTAVSEDTLDQLKSSTRSFNGIQTKFIADADDKRKLVSLISQADAIILSTREIRDAFLAKVRFDVAPNALVDEGLSLGSLEVGSVDRMILRFMRNVSIPDHLMRIAGARRVFASVASKLASSAAGFLMISATDDDDYSDLAIGRAWQNAWFALTEKKLACQPMMSLLVIQNILENAGRDFWSERDKEKAQQLLREFRSVTGATDWRPAVLMRFGFADECTARVGRLPVSRFIHDRSHLEAVTV